MNKKYDKKISILDWFIIGSIIIMFLMVYIPQNIWSEENHYKKERRNRMKIISQAEEFYYELTGTYTLDFEELFLLVESAMDSLLADSLFYGEQIINMNDKSYNVTLDKDFYIRVDTTFSIAEKINQTVIDTTYLIGVKNEETNKIDTFAINSNNLLKYKKNPLFVDVYATTYKDRNETVTNYLRKKFHLDRELIYCPISKNNLSKIFKLNIYELENNELSFSISSPLTNEDKEWRYGIFTYNPGKKESIVDGVKSWAEN